MNTAPAGRTNWRNMLTVSRVIKVNGVCGLSTPVQVRSIFFELLRCTAVKLSNTTVHCREGMLEAACPRQRWANCHFNLHVPSIHVNNVRERIKNDIVTYVEFLPE